MAGDAKIIAWVVVGSSLLPLFKTVIVHNNLTAFKEKELKGGNELWTVESDKRESLEQIKQQPGLQVLVC